MASRAWPWRVGPQVAVVLAALSFVGVTGSRFGTQSDLSSESKSVLTRFEDMGIHHQEDVDQGVADGQADQDLEGGDADEAWADGEADGALEDGDADEAWADGEEDQALAADDADEAWADADLPKGWEGAMDEQKGKKYYWREDDPKGTKTYKKPKASQALEEKGKGKGKGKGKRKGKKKRKGKGKGKGKGKKSQTKAKGKGKGKGKGKRKGKKGKKEEVEEVEAGPTGPPTTTEPPEWDVAQAMAVESATATNEIVPAALAAAAEANKEAALANDYAIQANFLNKGVHDVIQWSKQAVHWNQQTIQRVKSMQPPDWSLTLTQDHSHESEIRLRR